MQDIWNNGKKLCLGKHTPRHTKYQELDNIHNLDIEIIFLNHKTFNDKEKNKNYSPLNFSILRSHN
jgi:hypothetical protein